MTTRRLLILHSAAAALLLTPSPPLAGQEEHPAERGDVERRTLPGLQRDPSLVLEDRYRGILAGWCGGSATAAGDLSDLELDLADRRIELGDDRAAACFRGIEANTWTELTEIEPAAGLALAGLYYEVFLEQRKLEDPFSTTATKEKIETLLAGYLSASKSSEARQSAAMMFSVVAYAASIPPSVDAFAASREMFERALDLDPELDGAHYWSAFLAEKLGDARGAESHLKDLVARHPDDVEARLRLALNSARRGRKKPALDLLDPLAGEEGAPEWIRILATQETARLLVELGRSPEAVDFLRAAVERYPHNARLAVQLSYLLVSDWRQSSALVERLLAGAPTETGESPRVRYEKPRLAELIEVRQRLESRVREACPLLVRSLDLLAERDDDERRRFAECKGVELR